MTAPSANNWPTIGKPFTVEWSTDYTNMSPEVTLSLYQITGDCPGSACVELTDIAGYYANNGSFTWTPSSSLTAGNNYALLFINENPCLTVWGAAFGLHPAGYTGGSASGVAAAAAALVTNQVTATAAGTAAATTAAATTLATTTSLANVRYVYVTTTTTQYTYVSSLSASSSSSYTYTPTPSMETVIVTKTSVVYESTAAATATGSFNR
jgi:Ser-Thr-rich glycosyl-phosphatidyl-inositol-anchored membrane family